MWVRNDLNYHLWHPADDESDAQNGHEAGERKFLRRWHIIVRDVASVGEDAGGAVAAGHGASSAWIPADPASQDFPAGAFAPQMTQHPDHSQVAQHNAHAQQRTCSKERANRIRNLTEAQKVRTKFKDDSEVEGHSFFKTEPDPIA